MQQCHCNCRSRGRTRFHRRALLFFVPGIAPKSHQHAVQQLLRRSMTEGRAAGPELQRARCIYAPCFRCEAQQRQLQQAAAVVRQLPAVAQVGGCRLPFAEDSMAQAAATLQLQRRCLAAVPAGRDESMH